MISISSVQLSQVQIDSVLETVRSGHIVQGSIVESVERELSRYVDTKHAIAVNNGTAALHTALYAAGVKPGDEVITTPLSFVATANAVLMCGATPVFADVDPLSFTIDPDTIEPLITKKTKAVLVVDLYGDPVDYASIQKICNKHKLVLIADSCQAIGAEYKKKKVGAVADISVFSFYASKNIFSGEGGALTTNDDEFVAKARLFRNHGQTPGKQYEYQGLGYNYRLTDVLASILLPQLSDIDSITHQRQKNAHYLTSKLQTIPGIIPPTVQPGTTHCFHQYTIRLTKEFPLSREELQQYLKNKNIEARIYYPQLLPDIPHIAQQSRATNIPNARLVASQILSLPVHHHLSTQDLDTIASAVESAAHDA